METSLSNGTEENGPKNPSSPPVVLSSSPLKELDAHHSSSVTSLYEIPGPLAPTADSDHHSHLALRRDDSLLMPPPPPVPHEMSEKLHEPSGAAGLDIALDVLDWHDLANRHHKIMAEYASKERAIMEDFHSLCNYFRVWASVLNKHESPRSLKRLRTQITFVKHRELDLEQKRIHYIKVVEAFRSALNLLAE